MFDTKIQIYGLMLLFSLIVNIIIVGILSRKYKFTKDEIICLLLYENVGIIGGAKLLNFFQKYSELNGQFDFWSLGFTSYGAVIGALLFLWLFSFQFKKSLKEILYIFSPSIPLMYGIGKIGCFFAGCCYGIEYNGIGSVVYKYSNSAPPHIHLFPVQIVETFFFIGIFVYMMIKHKKEQFNLKVVGISFILCGFVKFSLDFLRDSHIGQILSLNQIISIVFILFGVGLIIINKDKDVK